MTHFYRNFIISVIITGIGTYAAGYIAYGTTPLMVWPTLVFLMALSLIVHFLLEKASGKRPQIFVAWFMGLLSAKLFLSAIAILIAGLVDKEHIKFTAIVFLLAYVLFTSIEVGHLLPLMKNTKDSATGE